MSRVFTLRRAVLTVVTAVLCSVSIETTSQSSDAGVSTSSLRFEVASIKRSADPSTMRVIRHSSGAPEPGGRWVASLATAIQIIRAAYDKYSATGQIVGGPEWATKDRFDIVAKAEPSRTLDELRQMVRALLAERFGLQVHTEKRDLPVYAVTFASRDKKLGPGLRAPEIDCAAYRQARSRGEPIPPGLVRYGDRLPCVAVRMPAPGRVRLTAGGTTIAGITHLLAAAVGRPVIDQTGLTEPFDIELTFVEAPPRVDSAAGSGDIPEIFSAIQEQLGLRLSATKAPVEVLVIDRISPPTNN